jgi:anaerobic selenocysteine-containing dehydrogenase
LRSGPYGDGFGRQPDGLTLARIENQPGGIDLGPLQPRIPEALRTPSGKIELAPPPLLGDLPRAAAELDAAPAMAAPGLVVIGRRDVRSNNSWMHNLPLLAKGPFRGTLLVNPADAARCGVANGARAVLRSAHGSLSVTVECSAALMPGVVSLPHGWGHDLPGAQLALAAERPGANLNALLDIDARDPLSGNAVLSGQAVELVAA